MSKPLYSTSAVALILGITPTRVRALAQARGLGRKPHGSPMWLFSEEDIEAMRPRRPGRPRQTQGLQDH